MSRYIHEISITASLTKVNTFPFKEGEDHVNPMSGKVL